MTSRWRELGACVVSAVLMTGAAAPSHSKDELQKIDACALLDAQTIQQALGVAVEKGDRRDSGVESNGAYSSSCVWLLAADRGRPVEAGAPLGGKRFVILNALKWPQGSDGARTYLQAFREASDSSVIPSKPSARSFGDESLWWGDGLAVRRGDISFGVSVFMPREATAGPNGRAGEREERLAAIVLARLAARDSKKSVTK